MRTYGKNESGQWVEIDNTSYIWLATLAQTLRLNQGESPFFANYGIPAIGAVLAQVAPNAAINRTQQQYAPYFSSLSVYKDATQTDPTYRINAVFQDGTTLQTSVAT